MAGLDAQRAVRMGAEELQEYMQELFSWSKEIKQKKTERKPAQAASAAQPPPPVQPPAAGPAAPVNVPASDTQQGSSAVRHPAGHTYDHYREKWDKFDLDAALAEEGEECSRPTIDALDSSTATRPRQQPNRGSSAVASQPLAIPQARLTVPVAPSKKPAAATAGGGGGSGGGAPSAAPTTAEGWKDAGNAHFKRGELQRAVDCYTSSVELQPSCLAHANRAMARLKLGQAAEAEADCSAALALDPLYVKAYQRRAAARHQQGNLQGAVEDCEYTLRLEPNNKQAAADRAQWVAQLLAKEGLQLPGHTERLQVTLAPAAPGQQAGAAPAASGLTIPMGIDEVAVPAAEPAEGAAPAGQVQAGQVPDALVAVSSIKRNKHEAGAPGVQAVAAAAAGTPAAAVQVISSSSAGDEQDEEVLPEVAEQHQAISEQPPAVLPAAEQQAKQLEAQPPALAVAAARPAAAATKPPATFKTPRTGVEFEKAWKGLRGDRQQRAAYLLTLQPGALPALLKQALTPGLLVDAASALLQPGVAAQPATAVALLEGLAAVPRFDLNLLSVPPKQRAELAADWDAALAELAAASEGRGELAARLVEARLKWKL